MIAPTRALGDPELYGLRADLAGRTPTSIMGHAGHLVPDAPSASIGHQAPSGSSHLASMDLN